MLISTVNDLNVKGKPLILTFILMRKLYDRGNLPGSYLKDLLLEGACFSQEKWNRFLYTSHLY